jgi:hypothetical protein
MKFDTSRYMQKALKHVQETYGFLFERGYEVFSAEVVDLGWQVVLRKQDLFIKVLNVREEEELYLRMGTPPPDEFTDIGSVLNAATGDMIPRWESSSPRCWNDIWTGSRPTLRGSMSKTKRVYGPLRKHIMSKKTAFYEPNRKNILQPSRKAKSDRSQNPKPHPYCIIR